VMAQDYFLYKGKIIEDISIKPIEDGHVRSSSQYLIEMVILKYMSK
jgi:hypothetical protein